MTGPNDRKPNGKHGVRDVSTETAGRNSGFDPSHALSETRRMAPTIHSVRRMKNLMAALSEINRRPSAAGGFPYEAYVRPLEYGRWDPNLFQAYDVPPMQYLQEEFVCEYGYEPDETVPIKVKGRIVQSGTIANRIIERAMARKLTANLDACFSDRSWAYRPGRSTRSAILQVRDAVRRGYHWAVKTDIEHFFPSINRKLLESQLRQGLADQRLCEMILRANSPTSSRRVWIELCERTRGVPQGNGLSPFLSNLYLTPVDEACDHLCYHRFADDVLILGRSFQEVLGALEFFGKLLAQLGLRLNVEKTSVVDLYEAPVTFLGYEIRGGNLYPPRRAVSRLEKKLRIRGQEARRINAMRQFVARYRIGTVRKILRRIDRELRQYYPAGITLTGILDSTASFKGSVYSSREVIASPTGKAAQPSAKKAAFGQAPVAVAAGEQHPISGACSLAPTEGRFKCPS